jgi:hypothetical protein
MLDIDYPPAVFAVIIGCVFLLPALYGMLLVDAFWKKNKDAGSGDDAFN